MGETANRTVVDVIRWVPVNEFHWPEPGGLFEVTCKNHPSARYLTKNPYARSLHLISPPTGLVSEEKALTGECKCPFTDLVVDPTSQD